MEQQYEYSGSMESLVWRMGNAPEGWEVLESLKLDGVDRASTEDDTIHLGWIVNYNDCDEEGRVKWNSK